jgi:hypothetical protein
MAIRRIVATTNVPAGQADAQMNPSVATLLALLATGRTGGYDSRVSHVLAHRRCHARCPSIKLLHELLAD